jgi:tRNA pseudouridine32 synthase/23S rRNA pseudouridine746 synthase
MDSSLTPPSLPAILAEGRTWFIIDKPPGLAVHPGPQTPESLEPLLPLYAPNRPAPQAVHRLDRDTSGCLLIARRHATLRRLSAAFEAGAVHKLYWALVDNPPPQDRGTVSAPLVKRSTAAEGWRVHPDPQGKRAVTHWEILSRHGTRASVAFRPETGRTHQIRVHATLLAPGAAIVGDRVYGSAHPAGMMLHARALQFTDPDTADAKTVEAPCPDRFALLGFQP